MSSDCSTRSAPGSSIIPVGWWMQALSSISSSWASDARSWAARLLVGTRLAVSAAWLYGRPRSSSRHSPRLRWPSAAARFTARVVFPDPPLTEYTAMIRPSCDSDISWARSTRCSMVSRRCSTSLSTSARTGESSVSTPSMSSVSSSSSSHGSTDTTDAACGVPPFIALSPKKSPGAQEGDRHAVMRRRGFADLTAPADDDVHAVGHLALLHDLLALSNVPRLQLARQPAHVAVRQSEEDRDSLQQLEPLFELGGLRHWFLAGTPARNARISLLKASGVHGLAMNPSQPAARAARSYIGIV